MFCGSFEIQYDVQSGIIMFVFGVFIMTRPKTFAGDLLLLIICTLNFTGMM